jgi:hypothetical protein
MGRKGKANHQLVVARLQAETAFEAAYGQCLAVRLHYWERWKELQDACLAHKPKLQGSKKPYPRPGGSGGKPGGQGVSPAALERMCEETRDGVKKLSLAHWKSSRVEAHLSAAKSLEENLQAGTKRCVEMATNHATKKGRKLAKKVGAQ